MPTNDDGKPSDFAHYIDGGKKGLGRQPETEHDRHELPEQESESERDPRGAEARAEVIPFPPQHQDRKPAAAAGAVSRR